jgi:starch phosphorylase
MEDIRKISSLENELLDHTGTAIHMAGRFNAVSQLHSETLTRMRKQTDNNNKLIAITNAQNFAYWADEEMYKALNKNDDQALAGRKKKCKQALFEEVADQNGEILDENILTIVFAKRFGGYKRPELLLDNMDRFHRLVTNATYPIQIVWAGKPYPMDFPAVALFDRIVNICKTYPNCSILTGYEMKQSKLLKQGADVWLNVPRITHEACGTSGMSAAMNGAVNVSIPDGWFPEFVKDKINGFIIPAASPDLPVHQQDETDANNLYDLLENEVIPMYYDDAAKWIAIVKNAMRDIIPQYDSNRMAKEYYEKLYTKV